MADLPVDSGSKIAGLVEFAITDSNGMVSREILNAQRIVVLPEKPARSHKWAVAVAKDGDSLTVLGEDGTKTELTGLGSDFEIGDRVIMLVHDSGKEDVGQTVLGLFKADPVSDRLEENGPRRYRRPSCDRRSI